MRGWAAALLAVGLVYALQRASIRARALAVPAPRRTGPWWENPNAAPTERAPSGEFYPPGPGRTRGAYGRAPGWLKAAIRAEVPVNLWDVAAALADCESDSTLAAVKDDDIETSLGPWQVNIDAAANPDLAHLVRTSDPRKHARAFVIIWRRQGPRAWLTCSRRLGLIGA